MAKAGKGLAKAGLAIAGTVMMGMGPLGVAGMFATSFLSGVLFPEPSLDEKLQQLKEDANCERDNAS